jgi:hypothetical protein
MLPPGGGESLFGKTSLTKENPYSRSVPYIMLAIGSDLRDIDANIIAEGVPARFAEIVRKLDDPE